MVFVKRTWTPRDGWTYRVSQRIRFGHLILRLIASKRFLDSVWRSKHGPLQRLTYEDHFDESISYGCMAAVNSGGAGFSARCCTCSTLRKGLSEEFLLRAKS